MKLTTYDNLNRPLLRQTHTGSAAGSLLSKSQTDYDNGGRVFRTTTWGVHAATGVITVPLVSDTLYDGLGRQIHDRVVTLGTGVVGGVRRISTEYDSRGMVSTLTTWDNATVGAGTILNQEQNVYNEFGQQTNSYQGHDGSVNVATTPVVRFNYYHGGGNRIRIAGMNYPNGRDLTYDYGIANGMNDACSLIESVINTSDSLNVVAYQHFGTSGFVCWSTGFSLLRFASRLTI